MRGAIVRRMRPTARRRLGVALMAASVILAMNTPAATQSLGSITLVQVKPRIITVNRDAQNDTAYFRFDLPITSLPVETAVYDINGARVSSLRPQSDDVTLAWDGRDDSGRAVPSGIYIYAIKIGKHRATGTVVVAR